MIETSTLSNGITIALERLPYVQSAAVGVWIRAGAIDETEHAGISHFIEHMMFKGTQRRSAKTIAEDIDRIGGSINAFTGKEATCYYVKTQSEHIGKSIDVLADMFSGSVFDPTEMEKEKNVVIEEMNMIEDSPEDLGHDLICEAVFSGSELGHSVIGTKDSVTAITRDDIFAYLASRYVAGNIVISVAGNFDPAAVRALLEEGFGAVRGGGSARSIRPSEFVPETIRRTKDIEQTHLFLGRRGTAMDADDYYTFSLYNGILGGGMSSRLFQNVREDKALAYSVYSMNNAFTDDGLFMVYAGVGSDKEREAKDAILAEIAGMTAARIPDDELSKAKEQSKGAYVFGQESISTRMFATGRNLLLLGRTFSQEEIMRGIDAVTPDDIGRIAQSYADPAGYTSVVISSDSAAV
ncbi:MAG: insulinase family protein [Clostridiales Family XIII bacterium]|jgi:predicted Zn-dependent peptidase|nr:insulinase family protein [Clostridiales Family XIII bacterium]